MTTPILEVRDLAIRFGGVQALQGVSFDVLPQEICGLIGPNGAGKTTLFNAISRVYAVSSGTVRFDGRELTALPADAIVRHGVARTFQNVGLFGELTVLDNVMLGAHHRLAPNFLKAVFAGRRERRASVVVEDEARAIPSGLGLAGTADQPAGALPFGSLKRVELARALLAEPRLLMLDEPANGLSHGEVDELSAVILGLRERYRLAVLIVEHHMRMVMRISDRVIVLENGRKIADGTPQAVRTDPHVTKAYLGSAA